jgi:hypothetical protein
MDGIERTAYLPRENVASFGVTASWHEIEAQT